MGSGGGVKEKRRQVKDEIATAIFLPALIVGFIIIPLFYYSIRRALSPRASSVPWS
jgi:two-component system sensor histidine kinase TctE